MFLKRSSPLRDATQLFLFLFWPQTLVSLLLTPPEVWSSPTARTIACITSTVPRSRRLTPLPVSGSDRTCSLQLNSLRPSGQPLRREVSVQTENRAHHPSSRNSSHYHPSSAALPFLVSQPANPRLLCHSAKSESPAHIDSICGKLLNPSFLPSPPPPGLSCLDASTAGKGKTDLSLSRTHSHLCHSIYFFN